MRWRQQIQTATSTLLLAFGIGIADASADPVRIDFELSVRHTLGDLPELFGQAISVGDTLRGRLTYDTSAPDTRPNPLEGNYRSAGTLAILTSTPVMLPLNDIWVFDQAFDPRPGFDDVFTGYGEILDYPAFDALQAEISFRGGGRTGDALPPSASEFISAFSTGGLRFAAWKTEGNPPFDSGTHELFGTVRAVNDPAPVPEPATWLLLAGGAAGIARRVRQRRAQAR